MKKLILLTLVTFIFSCKKEDIKPAEQAKDLIVYKGDHFYMREIIYNQQNQPTDTFITNIDASGSYIAFSEIVNDSFEMTGYVYTYSQWGRDSIRCTIFPNTIILHNSINQKYDYRIEGDVLSMTWSGGFVSTNGIMDSVNTITTYSKVSGLPVITTGGGSGGGTGGGSGGGSNCQYGQCQATAQSTGERCKKCVSNPGDIYCHMHD
jgi:hypothetical protein